MREEDSMAVFGLDPGSTCLGIAVLGARPHESPPEPPPLWRFCHLRPKPLPAYFRQLKLLGLDPGLGIQAVAVEHPPPTAKGSANHGRQAPIGHALGWYGGLTVGWLAGGRVGGRDFETLEPEPQQWRASMLHWSAVWGLPLPHAKDLVALRAQQARARARAVQLDQRVDRLRRVDDRLVVTYVGCDHEWSGLADEYHKVPPACLTCSAPKPARPRDELIREAWKEIACMFVRHHWPDAFQGLLLGAQDRARKDSPDRPAHTYAGLPDACEAVGIATVAFDR
jgi:hypothetical protein